MKRIYIAINLILLIATQIRGQTDSKIQFVWSPESISLYSKPNINSDVILQLEPGNKIKLLERIETNEIDTLFKHPLQRAESITVNMNWAKVDIENKLGYVSSTYLLDLEYYPNCTLDQFISIIAIQTDTSKIDNQCSNPDKTVKCENNITYKSVCRTTDGEIELILKNWSFKDALILLDRFEKISTVLKNGGKMHIIKNEGGSVELTDNMYNYSINERNGYIEVLIIWSC